MIHLLAQTKIEDVFKSTQDNFNQAPDSNRVLALVLGALGVLILLLLVNYRFNRRAAPRAVNHQGKLLKEVTRKIPLRSGELRQLKTLAEQQSCSSPLVLLLCPSLLEKGVRARNNKADPKVVGRVARKLGVR